MGLDPNDDDYQGGGFCPNCENVLFGGKVPIIVFASFSGIQQCPLQPPLPGDMTIKLSWVGRCTWTGGIAPFGSTWIIEVNHSYLVLLAGFMRLFFSETVINCVDNFTNQNPACGPMNIWGTGGIGKVTWGPDVPCV